jgi:plasmid replication initiation protein
MATNPIGYSDTPLLKKLGIKENARILLLNVPGGNDGYWKLIDKDCTLQLCKKNETPAFIHLFATSQKEFYQIFSKIEKRLKNDVIVWVSWYKKSSGIVTDMNEDFIRNFALQNNLVDVKVCAVTNEWSGLKLVIPVGKR